MNEVELTGERVAQSMRDLADSKAKREVAIRAREAFDLVNPKLARQRKYEEDKRGLAKLDEKLWIMRCQEAMLPLELKIEKLQADNAALAETVKNLADSIASPRRRIAIRNEAGDIVEAIDFPDPTAVPRDDTEAS